MLKLFKGNTKEKPGVYLGFKHGMKLVKDIPAEEMGSASYQEAKQMALYEDFYIKLTQRAVFLAKGEHYQDAAFEYEGVLYILRQWETPDTENGYIIRLKYAIWEADQGRKIAPISDGMIYAALGKQYSKVEVAKLIDSINIDVIEEFSFSVDEAMEAISNAKQEKGKNNTEGS